jgi:hypothetical protein
VVRQEQICKHHHGKINAHADKSKMRKRHGFRWAFIAGFLILGTLAPITRAQGAIRVESSQVLIPTVVFDRKLYALTGNRHHQHTLRELIARDPHFWDTIAVRGLAAGDFHLFEDAREQKIQSVSFEAPTFSIVKDNLAKHPETIGTGGGTWSYPDLSPLDQSVWLPWPQHVIAYIPPPSPLGSCHQVRVNMARANLVVWARGEYCNTQHPPSDPLNGTEFGKQMEEDLTSTKQSKIDLQIQAVVLNGDNNTPRVNIRIEFPREALRREFRNGTLYATIGTLGVIYNKKGTVAARFSDFACCDYGNDNKVASTPQTAETFSYRELSMTPNGYQTQLDLPPGEYDIRVLVSDGEKFGRTQMPLSVKYPGEKQLSISGLALCRRIRKASIGVEESQAKSSGAYVPLVSRGVAFTLTANSHFTKEERLFAYFEVFDPQVHEAPSRNLLAELKIVDAVTGDVKTKFGAVDVGPYIKPNSLLIPIARGIDLSHLQNGTYRLEVQVTDSLDRSTEWSSVTFVVDEWLPLEQIPSSCKFDLHC